MALKGYSLPTKRIDLPGDEESFFNVRGLSLSDLSQLSAVHFPQLALLFSEGKRKLAESDRGLEDIDIAEMAKLALMTAPAAVAHGIALAADEPEEVETIERLPGPTQLSALMSIAELTFHSDAEVKKLVEAVIQAMAGGSTLLQDLQSQDFEGLSGESVET